MFVLRKTTIMTTVGQETVNKPTNVKLSYLKPRTFLHTKQLWTMVCWKTPTTITTMANNSKQSTITTTITTTANKQLWTNVCWKNKPTNQQTRSCHDTGVCKINGVVIVVMCCYSIGFPTINNSNNTVDFANTGMMMILIITRQDLSAVRPRLQTLNHVLWPQLRL